MNRRECGVTVVVVVLVVVAVGGGVEHPQLRVIVGRAGGAPPSGLETQPHTPLAPLAPPRLRVQLISCRTGKFWF